VRVAVPFATGVVLAGDGAGLLVKTPWGLLTGVGPSSEDRLKRAGAQFRVLPPLSVAGIHRELRALAGHRDSPEQGPDRWLFSHEIDPAWTPYRQVDLPAEVGRRDQGHRLGAPVEVYRDVGAGPRVSGWGAVLLEGEDVHVRDGVGREAELFLQGRLERGKDLESRLEAALATVAWVMREEAGGWDESGEAPAGIEAIVGIHEAGHSYSVDRVGLSWIRP
jgi:hypothetical protein